MANYGKSICESFTKYFEGWEIEHRSYLEKLQAHQHDVEEESLKHLVEQVLCHYQEYYQEKRKVAESDVFVMFYPPWFSSFEQTLLWATGFKPSITFRILMESVGVDLNEEQNMKIAVVKKESQRMEKEITQAMASIHESVASQPFCRLIKREGSLVDGEVSDMENAMEELKTAMRAVIRDADHLRQHTAGQVLELLNLAQKVKFLVATSQFWLQWRRLGMQRDKQRN